MPAVYSTGISALATAYLAFYKDSGVNITSDCKADAVVGWTLGLRPRVSFSRVGGGATTTGFDSSITYPPGTG